MLTFLGTLLLLYLLWLVVKPLLFSYVRRKYTEKVNDMFNQAFGGQAGFHTDSRRAPSSAGGQRRQTRSVRKKIFSRDDGEYVDFEEVDVKAEYKAEAQDSSYTPREPQVSDADWEEIR